MGKYKIFLETKQQRANNTGFDVSESCLPDILYDFQKALVIWALKKGRSAIFADCGLGKTFMQLAWADQIIRKTNKRIIILTPLAVSFQTLQEAEKLGIEAVIRRKGISSQDHLVITNYERLHYFDRNDFNGVICDESSILKNYDGQTRKAITTFMQKMPYRLLCTATAAPNDYIELGTSSEALGEMGFADMLSMFFKKTEKTLSRKDEHRAGIYRFRGHAKKHFWHWVCSWARALRKPSDLGFCDNQFKLPPLLIKQHLVSNNHIPEDMLFHLPAINLHDQRRELRQTLNERCELAAELIMKHDAPAIAWCHLNDEGHLLERLIPGGVEVEGKDSNEYKEDVFLAFLRKDIRVLISKPTIAGFGLNLQHCSHQTFFPSHSYEQYYQSVRRCWRFGQKKDVVVDLISTEGQRKVITNLKRKAEAADKMFQYLVKLMMEGMRIDSKNEYTRTVRLPIWL